MFGGYAQYVARLRATWIKVRPDLDLDQGAAAMWPCATAHRIIVSRLDLRMNAAFWSPARLAAWAPRPWQAAKLAGATVIATTRYGAKHDKLSARARMSSSTPARDDALAIIREVTAARASMPRGVPGVPALDAALHRRPAARGTFCPVGGELRDIPLRVVDMVQQEAQCRRHSGATRKRSARGRGAAEKGRITMPIHAVAPLAEAARAHAMLEKCDDLVGRIVLHPWRCEQSPPRTRAAMLPSMRTERENSAGS